MADNKTAIQKKFEEKQRVFEVLSVSDKQLELTAITLDKLITTEEAGLNSPHHQRLEQGKP